MEFFSVRKSACDLACLTSCSVGSDTTVVLAQPYLHLSQLFLRTGLTKASLTGGTLRKSGVRGIAIAAPAMVVPGRWWHILMRVLWTLQPWWRETGDPGFGFYLLLWLRFGNFHQESSGRCVRSCRLSVPLQAHHSGRTCARGLGPVNHRTAARPSCALQQKRIRCFVCKTSLDRNI